MNIINPSILLGCGLLCLTPACVHSTGKPTQIPVRNVSIEDYLNRKISTFEYLNISLATSDALLDALRDVTDKASFNEAYRQLKVYNGVSAKINSNAESMGVTLPPNRDTLKDINDYQAEYKIISKAIQEEMDRLKGSGLMTRAFMLGMADYYALRGRTSKIIVKVLDQYRQVILQS